MQVLPALDSGGVERGTLEVAADLARNGHRSIVISNGGRMMSRLRADGSEHVRLPIGRKSLLTLLLIPRLVIFLRKNKVDILHVRSRFPAWVCWLALKLIPRKHRPHFITTVHGPYSVSAYSAIMTKGERVIVISEMIRAYVLKNYAVDEKKLFLNYRGVDAGNFRYGYRPDAEWVAQWARDYPETRGKKLLTLPARVTRWKGQEDFVRMLAMMKAHGVEAHGLIVGEVKPDKMHFLRELKVLALRLGVLEHVSFVGHRDDLREIMAISQIVFSLSREPEAFGRTTIEALSLGTPVIGYDHGGVGEQLGLVLPEGCVPVGDVARVAELAAHWLENPPVVPEAHPFRLQTMLANTLQVYESVMAA